MTSLVKLERGKPVGPLVYEAAARALPGWTEDTPRTILDDPEAPTTPTSRPEVAARPRHEWSAAERKRMQDMPMAEVQETYETFRRRSEYLSEIWIREVMRVKAEAEAGERLTTDS